MPLQNDSQHIADRLSGLVICIIDDSKAFLAGVKDLLRPLKCTLHLYSDPELALFEIPKKFPDIIITDYEMGDINAMDVIYSIRANKDLQTVPILILTVRNETEVLIATMLAGADAFVTKSSVRNILIPQLVTLARIRSLYKEVIRLKEFSAIKTMIGTYKHEFGNTLAILDGKIRKLERVHPGLATDESLESVKKNIDRMKETLSKLAMLREYKEEPYSATDSILKLS